MFGVLSFRCRRRLFVWLWTRPVSVSFQCTHACCVHLYANARRVDLWMCRLPHPNCPAHCLDARVRVRKYSHSRCCCWWWSRCVNFELIRVAIGNSWLATGQTGAKPSVTCWMRADAWWRAAVCRIYYICWADFFIHICIYVNYTSSNMQHSKHACNRHIKFCTAWPRPDDELVLLDIWATTVFVCCCFLCVCNCSVSAKCCCHARASQLKHKNATLTHRALRAAIIKCK